jgi:hypothetical protein
MSEATTLPQESDNQQSAEQNIQPPNPFLESSWIDSTGNQPQQINDPLSFPQQKQQPTAEKEEEILDSNEWLKREFNWESTEAARAEIEELRKLKESAASDEIEFENEESLNLFKLFKEGKHEDVYNFLENRRKLDKLVSSDINKETSAEIVKLDMQNKYKDLTAQEIEYKFNKQFGIPSKPVQQELETDDEYADRVLNWESKVNDIQTELMIEAKLARPNLEKLKSELVFPDIQEDNKSTELTQEELEVRDKFIGSFKQSAKNALDEFNGFNVSVKDEEVEIPLSYAISIEEKNAVAAQIEAFADSNFDANVILADRWLNENGEINTTQIVKDLSLLLSEGKMGQKFANEAASKRLAEHIRRTSNININSRTAQQTFNPESKSDMDKQIEYIWKNS